MSRVGFGAYRISIKSQKHYQALKHALESGCQIVDTSANYTNGESEELIGKVIKEIGVSPLLISKAGYIQGNKIDAVESNKLLQEEMIRFSEDLYHSIHPHFLKYEIEGSLKRLGVDSIDVYLLHNPEYYLKSQDSTKDEYYRRIKQAFLFLEDQVKEGRIKAYGISSNTFIKAREEHETTDLEKVFELVEDIPNHHFKYIQFPMNLLEMGALERQYEGLHLIEKAQALKLKTIINRPLNAITEHGLVRLANYEIDPKYTDAFAQEQFSLLMQPLVQKWEEQTHAQDEKLFEVPLMSQFATIWNKQNSPDGVDHLFMQYFFPFVAQVWGKNLSAEESSPFYDLYDLAIIYARKNMNERANMFKQQAIDRGLLFESEMDLSQMAVEKYQLFGVDIILMGMKDEIYVEKMKKYF